MFPCSWDLADQSVLCTIGRSDVDSDKNDGLKWRIAEPFRSRKKFAILLSSFYIRFFNNSYITRYRGKLKREGVKGLFFV